MTLDQALEKLQGLTHLEWHIVEGRFIRGKNPLSQRVFCPVTALVAAATGKEYPIFAHLPSLGKAIGLSAQNTKALAVAADYYTREIGLRQRLLEALSLKEVMK